MNRTAGTVSTVNLGVAVLVVAGYIVYGFLTGLPIDQHFLMRGPWGLRGHPKTLPAWSFYAVFEGMVVAGFLVSFFFKRDFRAVRGFCAVFSLFLLLSLPGWLPRIQIGPPIANSASADFWSRMFTADGCLTIYFWCSHLVYGLLGVKKP
jgi:hypothetical protein